MLGIFAWCDISGRICEDEGVAREHIRRFREETEPRIRFETGSFAELQQNYQQAGHKHKNALWHALQQSDIRLLEKLLAARPSDLENRPAFTCLLTLGGDAEARRQWLAAHYPQHIVYELDQLSLAAEGDQHQRGLELRQVKHFISVYGRENRPIVLSGQLAEESLRQHLCAFLRGMNAQIGFLQFEEVMAHPWEAHQWQYAQPAATPV